MKYNSESVKQLIDLIDEAETVNVIYERGLAVLPVEVWYKIVTNAERVSGLASGRD